VDALMRSEAEDSAQREAGNIVAMAADGTAAREIGGGGGRGGVDTTVGVFFFKQKTAYESWLAVSWARRCV
ncbi:hypothetical protein FRIG_13240, partial [Frigoribacterium faeni]|uniref:hypothetical protein n=1 Tax=Frigoribacterium faeni TaxID=145483 RepID=UPI001FAC78FA